MSDGPKRVVFRNVRELELLVDDSLVLRTVAGYHPAEGQPPASVHVEGGFINLGFDAGYRFEGAVAEELRGPRADTSGTTRG